MLEVNYLVCMTYALHGVLFILFCIKFWGLLSAYVIPYLRKQKKAADERFAALQEEHFVLVAQKKQLATQFLQQEKQIALLTAKLESWHAASHHKEKERENMISDRAQKMNERAAMQQHTVAQARFAAQTGREIVESVVKEMSLHGDEFFEQYIQRACAELTDTDKKDTMYESSYAKKTEGA